MFGMSEPLASETGRGSRSSRCCNANQNRLRSGLSPYCVLEIMLRACAGRFPGLHLFIERCSRVIVVAAQLPAPSGNCKPGGVLGQHPPPQAPPPPPQPQPVLKPSPFAPPPLAALVGSRLGGMLLMYAGATTVDGPKNWSAKYWLSVSFDGD